MFDAAPKGLHLHRNGRNARSQRLRLETLEDRRLLSAQVSDLQWVSDTPGANSFTAAAYFITISDAGDFAYIAHTDSNMVTVYSIDQVTGEFELTAGQPLQKIVQDASKPGLETFVRPHSLTISPDGLSAYVATQGANGNGNDAAIVTFDRNVDGTLTEKNWTILATAAEGDGIQGAAEVRISDDGKFVYVTGRDEGALAVFGRETTPGSTFGQLSEIAGGVYQSTPDLAGARGLAISPDGKNIYVTARNANTIVEFDRNDATGLFTVGTIIRDGVTPPGGTSPLVLKTPTNVIVSNDGKNVYVVSADADSTSQPGDFELSSLTVFDRNPTTGALTFVEQFFDGTLQGTTVVDGLGGAINLAISPDDSRLYVMGHLDGEGVPTNIGTVDTGALTIFTRDTSTGRLTYEEVQRRGLIDGVTKPITSIVDSNGKALINSLSHGLERADLIEITGTTSYNGLTRVNAALSQLPNVFTVINDFVGNETTGNWTYKRSEMRGAFGVAVSPDGRFVYTVNYGIPAVEVFSDFGNEGSLAAFVVDPLVVTSPVDSNLVGSLRYAINYANSTAGVDTITIDIPGPANNPITLDVTLGALPTITEAVTIVGADAIVDGVNLTGAVGLKFETTLLATQPHAVQNLTLRNFATGVEAGTVNVGGQADNVTLTDSKIHATTTDGVRTLGSSAIVLSGTGIWDIGSGQKFYTGGPVDNFDFNVVAGTDVVLTGTFVGNVSTYYDIEYFAYSALNSEPTLVLTVADQQTDAAGLLDIGQTFTGTTYASDAFFVAVTSKTGLGGTAVETSELGHLGIAGPTFQGVRGQPLPFTFTAPNLGGTGSNFTYTVDWGDRAGAITDIADGGAGTTKITSAGQLMKVGETVVITGTTNYDGQYTVMSSVLGDDFYTINTAFTVPESAGDWTRIEQFTGQGTELEVTHIYNFETARWTAGSPYFGGYNLQVTVTDGANYNTPAVSETRDIIIHELQANGAVTDLVYGGTEPSSSASLAGLDVVFFFQAPPSITTIFQEWVDGDKVESAITVPTSSITGKVVAYAQGSNNINILYAGGVGLSSLRAEFYGGPADDLLVGSRLADVLYGYGGNDTIIGSDTSVDGDDTLYGGAGDDVLYGGPGSDILYGEEGSDLLWGGRIQYASPAANWDDVINEWTTAEAYADRIDDILNDTFLNPTSGTTLIDDGVIDQLWGGTGLDWFLSLISFEDDEVEDEETGEIISDPFAP